MLLSRISISEYPIQIFTLSAQPNFFAIQIFTPCADGPNFNFLFTFHVDNKAMPQTYKLTFISGEYGRRSPPEAKVIPKPNYMQKGKMDP